MSFCGITEVILNQKVGPEHFLMRVLAPELTKKAKPGQFVHVRCNGVQDPLLRRPISLHGIDYEHGTVSLLYQVVGRGTQLLSEMRVGEEIDIMGPLGKGFSIPDRVEQVLVIGGGIGVAPLFPLVQALKRYNINQTILLGARSVEYLIGTDQLASLGLKVEAATDDGSHGYKGFVTDLMEKHIKLAKPDYFFACGPNPMLKQLVMVADKFGMAGQISLEERMGCGVGACLACVCKTVAGGKDKTVDFEYRKVCTEGPVFKANEVIFDD
ncbi:MAG: dihydroorotate dehydrogenase electron transfer subunit [Eubacteriales bacterium]